MVGVKVKEKARMEKAKVEKTKVKVLGIRIKTRMEKVRTRTIGIKVTGTSNGRTKAKERTKVVSLSMETNELQQLRIPKLEGSSQTPHQPEPEITALFALEEMSERSSRRGSRPEGARPGNGSER